MKKRIIWSNDYDATREEDWKEDFEDWCEINGYNADEEDIDEFINETLSNYLADERANLNKEVDGVIVVFAKLGLWDGTHNGAAIIGVNVKDILRSECDYCDWYCDDYNVRCDASHHDGTNHYLYRVAKDSKTAHNLVEKIAYEGMTEEQFRKATRSLFPYVAKVYGWKVKWMKKNN